MDVNNRCGCDLLTVVTTNKQDSSPEPEPIIEEPDETPVETVSSRELDIEVEEVEDTPQDSGQLVISSSTGSDGKVKRILTEQNCF